MIFLEEKLSKQDKARIRTEWRDKSLGNALPPTSETRFDFDTKHDIGMPMVIFVVFTVGVLAGSLI